MATDKVRQEQESIQAKWLEFLAEHPTRGGIAERLIFEAGYRAAYAQSAAPPAERSLRNAVAGVLDSFGDCRCEDASKTVPASVFKKLQQAFGDLPPAERPAATPPPEPAQPATPQGFWEYLEANREVVAKWPRWLSYQPRPFREGTRPDPKEARCEKCYLLGLPCAGRGSCGCACHNRPKGLYSVHPIELDLAADEN